PYALTDAIMHREIGLALWPRLRAAGLSRIYAIDKGILPFLVRNEEVGQRWDAGKLQALSQQYDQEYRDVCARLAALVGHELNPRAFRDVGETLFDELGVTATRPTSTGHYTTADKYLKARKHEHEAVALVIEARQIHKMKSTYTDKLPALLRDGRYHPNWKYTRTATGRPAETIILLL